MLRHHPYSASDPIYPLRFASSLAITITRSSCSLRPLQAFPTFPIVMPFRGTSFDVIDFLGSSRSGNSRIPGVNLDPAKVLDGERYLEIMNPLPLEAEMTVTSRVTGVYDVGKAAILENEAVFTDASGKPYVKIVSSAFYRWVRSTLSGRVEFEIVHLT